MTSTSGNRELCALASCRLLAPCCLWMAGGDWPGTCPQLPTHWPSSHSLTPFVQDPVIPLSQPPHDTII